ncbi:rho GTPase-activating protein 100F-like [Pollicipes pollicipes]|uniref:rho GTPase-activating protein 100F-like n=1 Tax=Pollicipes pollicipes TaxID=41117 RepID=UPI001884DB0F|nr:rho GTPase-activating protein 100F-like [Pollicipes pollicipes]
MPQMVVQKDFRKVSGISTEIFRQIETVENDLDASTAAALRLVEQRGEMMVTSLDPRRLSKKAYRIATGFMAQQDGRHTIQFVEIVKRPGQTLGLYIREGDGGERADGVFVSRIALESAVYNSGCLRVGDEVLAVNLVDVAGMGLDDVVIIMSIPRRLVLTTRRYPMRYQDTMRRLSAMRRRTASLEYASDSEATSSRRLGAPRVPPSMRAPASLSTSDYKQWLSRAPSTGAIYERIRQYRDASQPPARRGVTLTYSAENLGADMALPHRRPEERCVTPAPQPEARSRFSVLDINPAEFLRHSWSRASAADSEAGLSGLLSVQLLSGRGLRPAGRQHRLRDLYCVLECDHVHKARTVIRTGDLVFDWDETFELDLIASRQLDVLIYSWDPQFRHKLCYRSSMGVASLPRDGGTQQLALKVEPHGSLYVRLRYTEPKRCFERLPSTRPGALFGVDLETTVAREGSGLSVPLIVKRCVDEVERRGLDIIGLYRLCGSADKTRALRRQLEEGARTADLSPHSVPDINVITGVLKDYLRELPEPLFTKCLYQMLCDALSVCLPDDSAANAKLMLSILDCLPKTSRSTLLFLMDHLRLVASQAQCNKMTPQNVAICFGPVLMLHSEIGRTEIDFQRPISILKYLLTIWPTKSVREAVTARVTPARRSRLSPHPNALGRRPAAGLRDGELSRRELAADRTYGSLDSRAGRGGGAEHQRLTYGEYGSPRSSSGRLSSPGSRTKERHADSTEREQRRLSLSSADGETSDSSSTQRAAASPLSRPFSGNEPDESSSLLDEADELDSVRVHLYPDTDDHVLKALARVSTAEEVFAALGDSLEPRHLCQAMATLWDVHKLQKGPSRPPADDVRRLKTALLERADDCDDLGLVCSLYCLGRLGAPRSDATVRRLFECSLRRLPDLPLAAFSRLGASVHLWPVWPPRLVLPYLRALTAHTAACGSWHELSLVTTAFASARRYLSAEAERRFMSLVHRTRRRC